MKNHWYGKIISGLVLSIFVTVGLAGYAAADDFKHFGIRIRALGVFPNEDVDSQHNALGLKVTEDFTPELDLEFFFLRNLSTELILGVTKHDITSNGSLLGSTWLLPPTLTVKYHPMPTSLISPYVGVGLTSSPA